MQVGITVWEDRVSPVFDSAHMLSIARIEGLKIVERRFEPFNPKMPFGVAERLNDLKISVLICGAISETPANVINACGIELIPFVSGKVDEILESYAKGFSIVPRFLMPGCGKRCCEKRKKEVSNMPNGDGTGPRGQGSGRGRGKGRGMCNVNSAAGNPKNTRVRERKSGRKGRMVGGQGACMENVGPLGDQRQP